MTNGFKMKMAKLKKTRVQESSVTVQMRIEARNKAHLSVICSNPMFQAMELGQGKLRKDTRTDVELVGDG